MGANGRASFSGLALAGYDNQTCTLGFFVSQEKFTVSSVTCDIPFNGCPYAEMPQSRTGQFDTCVEDPVAVEHINQAVFLLMIIMLLLCCIMLLGCGTVFWEQYYAKPKPFYFKPAPKKEISLEDLLNDPDIPHIPWNQIEEGNRIGYGSTGIVLEGMWMTETLLREVALKEILYGNQLFTDGAILATISMEIRLMWYVQVSDTINL